MEKLVEVREQICICGHLYSEHGQEQRLYECDSKREVCLSCPGYEDPGYPRGRAWHRFKAKGG